MSDKADYWRYITLLQLSFGVYYLSRNGLYHQTQDKLKIVLLFVHLFSRMSFMLSLNSCFSYLRLLSTGIVGNCIRPFSLSFLHHCLHWIVIFQKINAVIKHWLSDYSRGEYRYLLFLTSMELLAPTSFQQGKKRKKSE